MNQQEVWNKIAVDWRKYRSSPVKEVIDFLKNKNGRLLDLSCGSGRNMIKQEGLEYYGVDFSDKMLDFARKNAENLGIKARLSKADASKLNFDDEFFDCAIFISSLHCIEGEKIRKKALSELFRVLKQGGEAMISVWNKEAKASLKEVEGKEGFIDWKKDYITLKRYYYFYDEDELIYLLKEIGFEIIKVSTYGEEGHARKNIVVYVRKE
jgi:tRNA (uracil-5-)-methyltransferase TRM9